MASSRQRRRGKMVIPPWVIKVPPIIRGVRPRFARHGRRCASLQRNRSRQTLSSGSWLPPASFLLFFKISEQLARLMHIVIPGIDCLRFRSFYKELAHVLAVVKVSNLPPVRTKRPGARRARPNKEDSTSCAKSHADTKQLHTCPRPTFPYNQGAVVYNLEPFPTIWGKGKTIVCDPIPSNFHGSFVNGTPTNKKNL